MSNDLAVATVSAALLWALQEALPSARIVIGRPVKPEDNDNAPVEVYIYLYQVTPNAALRNTDLPTRDSANARRLIRRPQAALDLHYLLVFYGDQRQLQPERNLGAAVRRLHEQPLFTRQLVGDAILNQDNGGGFRYDYRDRLAASNLADAVELVRLTPLNLSLEELSKIWSIFFQTPHGLSVAYQASVVLIESEETPQPALPVLRRGEQDQGVDTVLGPFPALDRIHVGAPEDADLQPRPPSYPSAQLGVLLTLSGRNLGGERVRVRFSHPRAPTQEVEVLPENRTATELRLLLPPLNDPSPDTNWAAGFYTVAVWVQNGAAERTTNSLPLPLAPRVTNIAPASPIARDANGDVTLTITCSPQVLPDQKVGLLLADREITAEAHAVATDTLTFIIRDAPVVTDTLVRLRVDGVDSLPFERTGPPPRLVFADSQKVSIT